MVGSVSTFANSKTTANDDDDDDVDNNNNFAATIYKIKQNAAKPPAKHGEI